MCHVKWYIFCPIFQWQPIKSMMAYGLFLHKDFMTVFTYSWKCGVSLVEAEHNLFISDSSDSNLSNTLNLNDARFYVFTSVAMKNAVFWDIRTQFVQHRKHSTSPLQIPAG
jgi:hypothetical protein